MPRNDASGAFSVMVTVSASGVALSTASRVLNGERGHRVAEGTRERVLERLKWVRPSFLSTIADSGSHWLERPIVANRLAEPDDDAAPR